MTPRIAPLSIALVLAVTAFPAAAQDTPACKANFNQEGSFFAGRRFTTSATIPSAPADAFKKIYAEGVKSGLKVASSEKDMGIINFEQNTLLDGKQITLPWNVVIEADGKGSKVSVTKTTPPTQATSQEFQITSMCAVIDAGR